jgi:hypothetical protein
MFSDATMRFGESLTTALLGLDALFALEQSKPATSSSSDIERLVVLNMSTTHEPDAFSAYSEAADRFAELKREAGNLLEPDRKLYYDQVCASALAFIAWRTAGLDLQQQIERFLHVPAKPASEKELDALRGQMRALLVDLGYAGDLAAQFQSWESAQRVPVDEIVGTLNDLLSDAWDRTSAIMTIPAEKSDGMKVDLVSGVPYNAMCDFSTRMIRLNSDPILTRPSLKHLAVHEGYPGHYVQFTRRRAAYLEGRSPADGLLSVVNTASSTPFEGIADCGLSVIGWDDDPDGRLAALLARYRSGLGTRAAWRLHAEGWDIALVKDELARDALVGGEGWVENRLKFISSHARSALIWSYWRGEPGVQTVWSRVKNDPKQWQSYFTWTYDRMHSVQSLALFPETRRSPSTS